MTDGLASSDWSTGRGAKWRSQIPGLEATLAPVDAPLLDALRLDEAHRVADIGCGGGGTSLRINDQAPAGTIVHGYDISPDMTAAAQARAAETGVVFTVADVAAAAAPNEPYGRVVSRFGTMFFDDPPSAFENVAGWLAPGGRFAFAVWGPPSNNPWMTSARESVAEVVDLPVGDPEAPGPFRYADPAKLVAILGRAGFSGIETAVWSGSLPIGGGLDAGAAARFALGAFSAGEYLEDASDEAREEAHRTLAARFSEPERDGVVRMACGVNVVTGTRA